MSVSLTGNDVVLVGGRIFNGVADGDYAVLDFDGDISAAKVSKDGNTIFALNQTGFLGKMTMRLLRGSPDDIFLNSLLQSQRNDFSGFVLMNGTFTKRVGDGTGKVANEVYILTNGLFKKLPGAKSNAEGDTEQSVVIYEIWFTNQGRTIA
jgi:hypothetical protein